MKHQLKYGLLLLLLCLVGGQSSAVAAVPQEVESLAVAINHTNDRPQWKDVGMCDLLAVTGSSTLTPPTTVRVVHDSPSGTVTSAQAVGTRHYSVRRMSAYSHSRTVCGYIYLIRCLRL